MKMLLSLFLLLNLNTATRADLEKLPGVGPVLAGRIIEFRTQKGGFRRIEELLAVPGISDRKWQVLRRLLTLD